MARMTRFMMRPSKPTYVFPKYGNAPKVWFLDILIYSPHLNAKVQGLGCFGYHNHFNPILAVSRRESNML